MPNVDVAMARSLRGGAWGSIMSGLGANLQSRQITETVNDVGTAFSSWDNCMAVSFCKWPVIAVIIIGGLIIISIIWCLARCLCCGLSCCCPCFSCLKCCGNCCGCFDPPGGRRHKYLDEPYAQPNQGGYKSQPPMFTPAVPMGGNGPAPANHVSSPPQYAEFDVSKKGDADSLPAMPTWEGAGSKKVSLEEEAVEMEPLKKQPQGAQSLNNVQTGAGAPLMANGAPGPVSPVSPYGNAPGAGSSSGYLGRDAGQQDPYGFGGQGYGQNEGYGGGPSQSSFGQEPGYGAAAAGMGMSQGRRTPHQDYNNPYGGGPSQRSGYDQDPYGQPGYGGGRGPSRNGMRGQQPPRSGPSPAPPSYRTSPGPSNNDYGYGQGRGGYPDDGYGQVDFPPEPQRQYSNSSRPLAGPPSPGIQNNGGFDFSSGYSRPQHQEYDDRVPQPQHQQRPPPSSGSEIAYPGYKAYQPAQQTWSGV